MGRGLLLLMALSLLSTGATGVEGSDGRTDPDRPKPRARELGLVFGVLPTGPHNAITDVSGVRVGHFTLQRGRQFNTGITAVLPHGGNVFHQKVPAAIVVGNGFGKLLGSTQVNELGELETPILLTGTLNVPKVADGLITYMLSLPGMDEV
ncbi:MAG: P1 family peptidase, partial [Thermoanaerobaculia bacterium]